MFLCDICHEVLKVATTACSEGHAFCKDCLKPSVLRCPTCRGPLQKTNCLPLQNIIDALEVKCTNQGAIEGGADSSNAVEDAKPSASKKRRKTKIQAAPSSLKVATTKSCDWTGPLSELGKHRGSCKFALIPCTNTGCDEQVLRRALKKHLTTCDYRLSKCKKCKQNIIHRFLNDHYCPKVMTACDFCNKRMLQQELLGNGVKIDDHHHFPDEIGRSEFIKLNTPTDADCEGHYKTCPKVLLRCEFHEQGCEEIVPRDEIAAHHANAAQLHARLVSNAFETMATDLVEKMSRESITLRFAVAQAYLGARGDYVNARSDAFVVGGHSYRVKLYQQQNEPIEVGIISNSATLGNCSALHDVHIRIATSPREEPLEKFSNGFASSHPEQLEQLHVPTMQRVCEFKTKIPYGGQDQDQSGCTTIPHLEEMSRQHAHATIWVVVSFSISVKQEKVSRVCSVSSPRTTPYPTRPRPNRDPQLEFDSDDGSIEGYDY
jgi:hypothetical protein